MKLLKAKMQKQTRKNQEITKQEIRKSKEESKCFCSFCFSRNGKEDAKRNQAKNKKKSLCF
jgi:hypothetical protein